MLSVRALVLFQAGLPSRLQLPPPLKASIEHADKIRWACFQIRESAKLVSGFCPLWTFEGGIDHIAPAIPHLRSPPTPEEKI